MSRKTRKLIWSAPLVAVLAVAGALAIFAAVMPGDLLAHGLPGGVANLTATADGYHTVNLGWDAPAGDAVDGYRIDRSLDGNTWVTYVTDHQGTTYTDNNKSTNLKAGTAYYYRVFAVNSAGTGPVSRDVTTQTDIAKVPEMVEGLSAQAVDQNTITVSWSTPASDGGSPIKNYEIHWNIDGVALPAADVRVTNGNVIATTDASTSYTHEERTAGTRYRYQVYAVNGVGKATDSGDTAAAITRDLVKPGAPTGVTAVQTGDRAYNLYWYTPRNTGGAPVSRYKVQVSLNGSQFADAADAAITLSEPNPTPIVIGNTLTEQASYDVPPTVGTGDAARAVTRVRFQVFAETGDTNNEDTILTSTSAGSTGTLTLLAAGNTLSSRVNLVPDDPTAVTAVRDGFKNVDLAWTAPATNAPAADGTDTYTGPDSIGGYRIDVSDNGVVWRSLIDHTRKADPKYKYVDTEVKVRYYRVFAWHGQYLGEAHENPIEGVLTRGAAVAPDHVSGLTLTVVGPTQIDLSWTAPANNGGAPISRYIIQTSKRDDATPPVFAAWPVAASANVAAAIAASGNKTSMSTSYSHTELSAGETWRYRVLAVNKVDTAELLTDASDSAEVRQGTTHQEQMPEAPEMLTAESARDSSSPSATDRGVLLLWNAPSAPDGADIGGYRVQRMKDGGAWETLQSNTLSAYTNYTDSEEPEMGEMRGYRVAAISTNNREGAYSNVAYIPAAMHTHNASPMAVGMIDPVTVTAGEMSDAMDVSAYFSDADTDDTLTYAAMSNMEMYATAEVDDMGMLTITGVAAGPATITVTATDAAGAYAMQPIMVTVEAANTPPMADGTIDPVTVTAGEMSDAMDVSGYFSDADMGDTLTYTAMSDMEMYATADIPAGSSMLTITGVAAGPATITVTATDMDDATATQEIMVTVEAASMELTAPTGVSGSLFAGSSIIVSWDADSAQNADLIVVALFNEGVTALANIPKNTHPISLDAMDDPGTYSFDNVPSGTYKVAVASESGGVYKVSLAAEVVTVP